MMSACSESKTCSSASDDTPQPRVLVGCTGSVAAIKLQQLVTSLQQGTPKVEVQAVLTEHSQHFFDKPSIPCTVYTDEDEWKTWTKRGDPVLHIELRRWADVMIIAPLDANTLAKIANGLCDNLLTCVVRAWDHKRPLLFAPAMNTYMWDHPITEEHVNKLQNLGYRYIPPIEKTLMCGDTGSGAMAEVPTLVAAVQDAFNLKDKVVS